MAYRFNAKDHTQIGKIRGAVYALSERIGDLQSDWDDATERWQDSDRGMAVQEWLTEMEDKLREIEDLADEIEDAEPSE